MNVCGKNIILLVLAGILLFPEASAGQQANSKTVDAFVSRGAPLASALQELVKQTDLDLIYDPRLVHDHTVYVAARNKRPEEILRLILENSGLDFIQLSSGTYVLVRHTRQETLYGHLSGKVIDKTTGKPLEGAHVMLADASTGTATNSSGYFNISRLESGKHEVTVTYVGYQPVRDTVWVPANQGSRQDFSLDMKPVWVEPIIVSDIQKRLPASDAFIPEIEKPSKSTLGTVDAIKSMNTVMGITFDLGLADYNIQGGNTAENELRLDGVPIYNPVSMGRLIGAFSPYALGNIEIYKAGFGSSVGSQLSGIINIEHDFIHQQKQSLLIQADPLSINGRLDHQITLEQGPTISLMLAARANIWRWYQEPGLSQTFRKWDHIDPLLTNSLLDISDTEMNFIQEDHRSDIRYSDLHFAAAVKHSDFQTTHISAYMGNNYLQTNLFSENRALVSAGPHYISAIDRYNWTNMMGKVEHDWLISPRWDANISGYVTRHSLSHQYAMGNDLNTSLSYGSIQSLSEQLREGAIRNMSTGDKNGITESAVSAKFNYSVSKNYKLHTGFKATHLNYQFQLSDLYLNTARSQTSSFLISNFIQNNIYLSHKTSLSGGSRFTFVPSRDLVFAEPRLSLQHDRPDSPIGYLSAKLSGGIYRQFINQFEVSNIGPSALVPSIRFWVPVDYSMNVPKAYHLAVNLLWEPGNNWTVKAETYYKWMPQTLSLNYDQLSGQVTVSGARFLNKQAQFITDSKQLAYGAGLSLEKVLPSLGIHLKTDYQYSFSQRLIPGRFNSTYEPVPWNQPHQLGLSAEWQVISNLMMVVQWKSIWGRSWGFRKAYYDYLALTEPAYSGKHTFDNPSADKLPAFHQLDAGASYKREVGSTSIQFRLDLFNLLNHQNIINWWLSPGQNGTGNPTYSLRERNMPGFSPSFSVIFSF